MATLGKCSPQLSPQELAVCSTDEKCYVMSEGKVGDLVPGGFSIAGLR